MENLSPSDLGYLAGFIDGEGCISIGKRITPYLRYQLVLSVSQNNREVLEWIVSKVGGSLKFQTGKRSYSEEKYERWTWTLSSKATATLLTQLQPYLIVKRREAEVALQFYATTDYNRRKVPPDVMEFREYCFNHIKEIRGTQYV